jgi:hypothetical protein
MQKMVGGQVPKQEPQPEQTMKEPFGNEEFWYNNPLELIRKDRICSFIPQPGMTPNEYLNSIARLGIYSTLILALLYNNHKYLVIIAIVLLITIFLHNKYTHEGMSNPHHPPFDVLHQQKEGMSTSYNCAPGYQRGSIHNDKPQCGAQHPMLNPYSDVYKDNVKKKGLTKTYPTDRGDIIIPVEGDQVCSLRYTNETTGGYNWISQSDHADFRGNSRLVNNKTPNETMLKMTADISDAFGKELASRNSYIPVHARDIVNNDFEHVLYGRNLDRRMYFGRR